MKTLEIHQDNALLTVTADPAITIAVRTAQHRMAFELGPDEATAIADFIYDTLTKIEQASTDAALTARVSQLEAKLDRTIAQLNSLLNGLNVALKPGKPHVN